MHVPYRHVPHGPCLRRQRAFVEAFGYKDVFGWGEKPPRVVVVLGSTVDPLHIGPSIMTSIKGGGEGVSRLTVPPTVARLLRRNFLLNMVGAVGAAVCGVRCVCCGVCVMVCP